MKVRKLCRKCKRYKTKFHKNARNRDGLQDWCVECNGKQMKAYYSKNKTRYRAVNKAGKKTALERNRAYVMAYLSAHPCVDCGETDPVVLEFDHVRGIKVKQISDLIYGCSLEALVEEIAKCEVRCANDHRRRTAKLVGSYKCQG